MGLKATADRRLAVSGTRFGPAPGSLPEVAKLHIQGFAPMFCSAVALLETRNLKAWHARSTRYSQECGGDICAPNTALYSEA